MRFTSLPPPSKLADAVYETIAGAASQNVDRPLSYEEMQKPPSDILPELVTWVQKFKMIVTQLHARKDYGKYLARFQYSDSYAQKAYKVPCDTTASDIAIKVYHAWEKKGDANVA